jgi:hypothetical protein
MDKANELLNIPTTPFDLFKIAGKNVMYLHIQKYLNLKHI